MSIGRTKLNDVRTGSKRGTKAGPTNLVARWTAATWIDTLATFTLSRCDIRKTKKKKIKIKGLKKKGGGAVEDGGQQYVSSPVCSDPIKDNSRGP